MVAAHVLEERTPGGDLALPAQLVEGRASALFAVLAGVSLALMTRRGTDARARAGLAVRALLIAVLGFVLGELETGIAVILTYYGVLFVLGLPFIALRARTLYAAAAVWVVAGPAVSHVVRPHLPERQYASPAFDQLAHPGRLLSELLLTGYYPAVPWLAYLLLGLAIGRTDLHRRGHQVVLAVSGFAAAGLAFAVSRALTEQSWVLRRLLPDAGGYGDASTGTELVDAISGGMGGTTPTDGSWAWLLVVAPHSATPFDLFQTGASAAAVIGTCLVVLGALGRIATRLVAVGFGAGTMTLTLYSLHVVMGTERVWPTEEASSYGWHVLVLMAVGAAFVALRRRGPLETAVGWAQSRLSRG